MGRRTSRTSSKSRQGFGRNTLKGMGVMRPARSKSGLVVCKVCGIYFTGKRWVHSTKAKISKTEEAGTHFTVCPACRMEKDRACEGEVVLRNISPKQKQEVLAVIRRCHAIAFARDPLERVLRVEERGKTTRVLTSENQLAVRIGRELKQAFKGTLDIRWSRNDEPVYVVWDGARV